MPPEFESLPTTTGLEVLDSIESRRFALRTSTPVAPTSASTEEFAFPVTTACEFRADGFELPYGIPITVRAPDGTFRDTLSPPASKTFPADEYLVELDAAIKVYLRFDGPLAVEMDTDDVTIAFGEETHVRVGARSLHDSPAATITVPDDPEATMRAVSALSSSLKTTSPERSWPTLRGHPPEIERGDELAIPDRLDPPDTAITIEVPREYGSIYGVAPLAFYLGADVVPGDAATLRAETGVERRLGDDATTVSETASEILKRVLLLDCVTRTEGHYSLELHERNVLEPQVDLDFADLYDASPSERLAAYLSVPEEAVASVTPTWHRVAHVEPSSDAVELLPYLVNDLAAIRVEPSDGPAWTATENRRTTEEAIGAFVRRTGRSDEGDEADDDAGATDGENRGIPGVGEYVPLPDADALEQVYVGSKTPERGAKLLPEAFEHDAPDPLEGVADPSEGVVEITVVCNDEEMRAEWDSVSEIYGGRDDVYVDVDCRFGVATDELRTLLGRDHDVFHFIGHIDGLGFECPDGILDAATLDSTGATTVLLNGCRSHDQGVAMVESGANVAIVSLGDVANEGAIEVGETLARLLHHGFSVGSAMEIVREYTSIGRDYLVVGDPAVTVVQLERGIPILYRLLDTDDSRPDSTMLTVEPIAYSSGVRDVGSLFVTYLPGLDAKHVAVGTCGQTTVSAETFRDVVSSYSTPFVKDGDLIWCDEWL